MDPLPPGSKVRFRVTDDDLGCGASWAVETTKTTGDVYVFHREGARWIKSSLHESGQWHYSTSQQGKTLLGNAPPYFGITKQRAEIAPGWTRAKAIIVAHSELRTGYTEAVRDKGVIGIPIERTANATSVEILLGRPDASTMRVDNALLVAAMKRGDDGLVFIYATPVTLTQPIHQTLSEPIAAAKSDLRDLGWDGTTPTRIAINGLNEAGHMQEFDIAIDPDAAAPDGPQ